MPFCEIFDRLPGSSPREKRSGSSAGVVGALPGRSLGRPAPRGRGLGPQSRAHRLYFQGPVFSPSPDLRREGIVFLRRDHDPETSDSGEVKSQRDRLTLHQPIRLRLNVASNVASVKKHIIFWGRFRRFFGGRFRRIQNHSTTHRAQHTQQHTAHTRAKPTNLSPAGRLGGTPTAHKRETCHRHSRGRLVDLRTQLHRTRPQGQKLGPKDRISCGPASLATSSNPRRQVGSSRGFGGIPLHQMSSLKVGVRSLERVWWMLQSWRQRQQQ